MPDEAISSRAEKSRQGQFAVAEEIAHLHLQRRCKCRRFAARNDMHDWHRNDMPTYSSVPFSTTAATEK